MAKYENRFRYEMSLSNEQIDKVATISAITLAVEHHGIKGKDVPNLNPDWWNPELRWKKDMSLSERQLKELENKGKTEWGFCVIEKTKKGYIIRFNKKYLFKNIIKSEIKCLYCDILKPLNMFGICKSCEEKLKSKRKYMPFLLGKWDDRPKKK